MPDIEAKPAAPAQEPADDEIVVAVVDLRPNDVYTPFLWCRQNLVRWVSAGLLSYIFYDLFTRKSEALRSFPDGDSILEILVLLAVLILCGLLVFPYLRMRAVFWKSPAMTKPRTIKFGAAGVSIRSDDVTSECKWSLFQRVIEMPKVFMLSYSGYGAMYVPKRALGSREEIVRLRRLFREHLPGRVQLRND